MLLPTPLVSSSLVSINYATERAGVSLRAGAAPPALPKGQPIRPARGLPSLGGAANRLALFPPL